MAGRVVKNQRDGSACPRTGVMKLHGHAFTDNGSLSGARHDLTTGRFYAFQSLDHIGRLRTWMAMDRRLHTGRKHGLDVVRCIRPPLMEFQGTQRSNVCPALRAPMLFGDRVEPYLSERFDNGGSRPGNRFRRATGRIRDEVPEQRTVRMSRPASSRCVANECRRVWHVAGFGISARRTASFTARWSTDSWRWWRRR
jgi:hypothetical protein